MKIPGNPILNDYAIRFDIDWDMLTSGTYIYSSGDKRIHQLGGGRAGYTLFYPLIMDFKFKDGREYHENINIEPLIQKMVKNHKIFDLSKTKWGGFATINIKLESNRLVMNYELSEMIKKGNPPMMRSKYYRYPVFEKILD